MVDDIFVKQFPQYLSKPFQVLWFEVDELIQDWRSAKQGIIVLAGTQSVSPLGTTTSVDSSQIAKYSLGGGLSEGARSLHDFYLSLAKQATPVIEVGASKKITVIISEGKELEIRELEVEGLWWLTLAKPNRNWHFALCQDSEWVRF